MFKTYLENIEKNILNLKQPRILVIGDFAIDEMIYGQTERISREAPVLILQHTGTKIILGGAANAANNIAKINDGKVSALGVCGEDYHADVLIEALEDAKINTNFMVRDKNRKTTTKTRVSGSCSQSVTQQIVRIDRQTNRYVDGEIEQLLISHMQVAIPEHDAVILSDYHISALSDQVIDAAISISKANNKLITVDAQKNLDKYKNINAITPNQPDTERFLGYFLNFENLSQAGKELLERLNAQNVLITRGSEGMVLFEKSGNIEKIPAINKTDVFDVTGAGDTVIAIFTLALAAGFSPLEAAILGNAAAGVVIRYFGCHTTTCDEILDALKIMEKKEN